MTDLKTNMFCACAELHYYDFIHSQEPGCKVPLPVLNHIRSCKHCQSEAKKLEFVLSQANDLGTERKQQRQAVVHLLGVHLAYVGKPMTCNTVKPLLPSLSEPELSIRIPTPVTAHVDKCQQCQRDLETIRQMNLNHRQLQRLSALLAIKSFGDKSICAQARSHIDSVARMSFGCAKADVLQHPCICPDCREQLFEARQALLKELTRGEGTGNDRSCCKFSATDIFDCAIPYATNSVEGQWTSVGEHIASHLRNCPTCLSKVQEIHKAVYGIMERPESGVATIYNITESAKVGDTSENERIYAGFPVTIELAGRVDESVPARTDSILDSVAGPKRKSTATNLKLLVKTAPAAAAAIIIVATALILFNRPFAKEVTVDQIYNAVNKAGNIYVATAQSPETGAVDERWVSRALGIYIVKNQDGTLLWDVGKQIIRRKGVDSSVIARFSPITFADVKKKMRGASDVAPFGAAADIPRDAKWDRVIAEELQVTRRDTQIYELQWKEETQEGSSTSRKWRIFVDPKTNLPVKSEFYREAPAGGGYTLESAKTIEYLNDRQMQRILENISF